MRCSKQVLYCNSADERSFGSNRYSRQNDTFRTICSMKHARCQCDAGSNPPEVIRGHYLPYTVKQKSCVMCKQRFRFDIEREDQGDTSHPGFFQTLHSNRALLSMCTHGAKGMMLIP